MPQILCLRHTLALGDTLVFTALARDIALTYPGRFDIRVISHFKDVWKNNPYVRLFESRHTDKMKARNVTIGYRDGIIAAGKGEKVHMLAWFHRDFSQKMKLPLRLLRPGPDIHLDCAERESPLPGQRYWLVVAGGKKDVTCKWWWPQRHQQLVDSLHNLGITCVQAGAVQKDHWHPRLDNVIDMVGKTSNVREFLRLVAHADGVICPITAAMHAAAAFEKPCVVIAGGREEPWWEAYVNNYKAFGTACPAVRVPHRYLHTVGQLDCCRRKGCWKHRTTPLGDGSHWDIDTRRCKLPLVRYGASVPGCLDMITTEHVVEAVMSYYEDGTLPPVSEPAGTYRDKLAPEVLRPVATVVAAAPAVEPEKPAATSPPRPSSVIVTSPRAAGAARGGQLSDPAAIDDPIIGGRLTVCVLCFGDHVSLARKCLESIVTTLPAARMDLRVALNAVGEETLGYVSTLPVTRLYDSRENAKKYPMMRRLFHDETQPLQTNYLVWFDDDTQVVDPGMWSQLCQTIVREHPQGARLYGWPMQHDTQMFFRGGRDPLAWFRGGSWWRGRNFQTRGRAIEAPNGTVIPFVPGWFWAVNTDTIRAADIPDTRLNHNGGDITIGAQVFQQGGRIAGFNQNKRLVYTPPREQGGRRGFSEAFPWSR